MSNVTHIGIYTFHRACNYGAVLQAYALQSILSRNASVQVSMVDHRCDAIENTYHPLAVQKCWPLPLSILRTLLYLPSAYKRLRVFTDFCNKHLVLSSPEQSQDILISGSDQVWNARHTGDDDAYFLALPSQKSAKHYSYAASCGTVAQYLKNKSYIDEMLRRMDKISVRETSLANALPAGMSVRTDIDPTLLLSSGDWQQLCKGISKRKKPYILVYTVQTPKNLIDFARMLAKRTGLEAVYLNDNYTKDRDIRHLRGQSPQQFLSLFLNANFVVTTSFHGTVFSLLFHRPFFVELEGDSYNERVANLLEIAGLSGCREYSLFSGNYNTTIDWDDVDKRLAACRADSLAYLQSIIEENKDNSV